jgi:hypothetical protein
MVVHICSLDGFTEETAMSVVIPIKRFNSTWLKARMRPAPLLDNN